MMRTSYQIGFPLFDRRGRWEFVLPRPVRAGTSELRWYRHPDGKKASGAFISETGAGAVLRAKPIGYLPQGFDFLHVASVEKGEPARWIGTSDTVACMLSLAQSHHSGCSVSNKDAPIILVSCSGYLGRDRGDFSETRILSVSTDSEENQNVIALMQKWTAALGGKKQGLPVLALVLHEEDADRLESKAGITAIPLKLDTFRELAQRQDDLPALVSVTPKQMALLARALEIPSSDFTHIKGRKLPGQMPTAPYGSYIYFIPVIIILVLISASGIGPKFTVSNYQKMLMSFFALFPLAMGFRLFWKNISRFPPRHRAPMLAFLVVAWIFLSSLLARAGYQYYKAYLKQNAADDSQAQVDKYSIDNGDSQVGPQSDDLSVSRPFDAPDLQKIDHGSKFSDFLPADVQTWRRNFSRRGMRLDGGTWAGFSLSNAIQNERGEVWLDIDDSGMFTFRQCRGRVKGRFFVATCGTTGNSYLLVGILHKSLTLVTANAFRIINSDNQNGAHLILNARTLLAPWEGIMLISRDCPPRNDEWTRIRARTYWWTDIDAAAIASSLCDTSICPAPRFISATLKAAREVTQVVLQEQALVTAFRFERDGFLPSGYCSDFRCGFGPVTFSSGERVAPCKIVGVAQADGAPLLQQGDAGGISLNSIDVDTCPSGVTIGLYRHIADPFCH